MEITKEEKKFLKSLTQQKILELRRKSLEQEKKIKILKSKIRIDMLTQLYNKKAFDENLATLINHIQREHKKIILLYFDIDHFKKINDTYGHAEGDKVLKIVGQVLKRNIRATERGYRIGGEEFAIIFTGEPQNWTPKKAIIRIQKAITEECKKKCKKVITISGGTAAFIGKKRKIDVKKQREKLKEQADKALYKAKKAGRKQIIFTDKTKSVLNV